MRPLALRIALLAALGCAVAVSRATPSMGREWRPANSELRITAEVESYDGKEVRLTTDTGLAFDVAVDKLSAEDQDYLKQTYPNGKPREKKPKDGPAKAGNEQPAPETAEVEKPSGPDVATKKPAAANPRVAKRAAARVRTAKADDFDVEVVSLTVTKPPKNAAEGNGGAATGLVPGTHATLLVTSPSKTLLRVDAEKTKVDCADDQATNLSKPLPGGEETAADSGLTLEVTPDGKSGTIVFDFPQAPSAKATRIRLKGELHLVCGSDDNPETLMLPLSIIVGLGL